MYIKVLGSFNLFGKSCMSHLLQGPDEGHICYDCWNELVKDYRATKRALNTPAAKATSTNNPQSHRSVNKNTPCTSRKKRTLTPSTSGVTPQPKHFKQSISTPARTILLAKYRLQNTLGKKVSIKTGVKRTIHMVTNPIVNALHRYKYYTALNHIVKRGKAAENALQRIVQKLTRKQMRQFTQDIWEKYPSLDGGIEELENFEWEDFLQHLDKVQEILPFKIF